MVFEIFATKHTAEFFMHNGLPARIVNKISEGRPNVVDIIKNRDVGLIVNTPSGKASRADGYQIRRNAVIYGIPIVTTLAAASATVDGSAYDPATFACTGGSDSYYVTIADINAAAATLAPGDTISFKKGIAC